MQVVEHGVVVIRANDDRNTIVVLRCGADHGRSADIDILDGLINGRVFTGDGLFERIQVDDQKIDRLDAVLFHNRLIRTAATEQSAVDEWMQRLDAAVHDFRKARLLRHLDNLETGVTKLAAGAAG